MIIDVSMNRSCGVDFWVNATCLKCVVLPRIEGLSSIRVIVGAVKLTRERDGERGREGDPVVHATDVKEERVKFKRDCRCCCKLIL